MDVHDGFITGIHNYCDRWCETCAYTSWCRAFADDARQEAAQDPSLKAVVDAPLLPRDIPPAPPAWLLEMLMEAESEAEAAPDPQPVRPELDREDHPLLQRSRDYFLDVHRWLAAHQGGKPCGPADPVAVVSWFASLIPAKIGRALSGLAWAEPGDPDDPRDYDGSAKVALIGIERSHAAWLQIADAGANVGAFIAELVWMGEALEWMFPSASAFVRPAFDEPEAVSRLLAETS